MKQTMSASPKNQSVVSVLPSAPLPKPYDYLTYEGVKRGGYVEVPLGSRKVLSVVWDTQHHDGIATNKLKAIETVYDFPVMPDKHLDFLQRVSAYTMAPLGSVLKLSLSSPAALQKPKKVTAYRRSHEIPSDVRITTKRQEILSYLQDQTMTGQKLKKQVSATPAVLKKMVEMGLLETVLIDPPALKEDIIEPKIVQLTETQQQAVDFFIKEEEKPFSVGLLDGVTGSGKTEVYFELIDQSLKKNEQCLVLLPEIALTQQVIERFTQRFGFPPTLWHSHLTAAQRRDNWRAIAKGEARVIVGARSALFLPYPNLNCIVIDEEHDPAYKQEEGVRYHARDMAVMRALVMGGQIILASATPSLETVENVKQGKYSSFVLPSRYGQAMLPTVHLIDLKKDKPEKNCWISPALTQALRETFDKKEQSLLFLNRRGFAPLTLCRECGHRFQCPNCDAWLVSHKRFHRLQCHHCGYMAPTPNDCPECGSIDSLAACGPGVDRLLEEVRQIVPLARTVVFTSDHMSSPDIIKTTIQQITRGYFDVMIGTQMLAKGHHFPHLTTVGVVDADMGMSGGDLRAGERSYQLLHQVAGRAGREKKPGHVYIQTFQPQNKVMQALANGDRDAFLEAESAERALAEMPPFSRLVALILSDPDQNKVEQFAENLAQFAPTGEGIITFGPAPAPIGLLRGRFRYRFLIRAEKHIHVQKTIEHWLKQVKKPSTLKLHIDIDPMSFL